MDAARARTDVAENGPAVDPARLREAVSDLQTTSPWRGLFQIALRVAGQVLLVWFGFHAWASGAVLTFFAGALLGGLWFASMMSITHDAIHRTLTGIEWVDEVAARVVAWPMMWPIGSYARIHALHHKLNGVDLSDPERVTPTEEEYRAASSVGRFCMRHRLWFRPLVTGAFGMVIELWVQIGRRIRRSPPLRRSALRDALGIGVLWAAFVTAAYGFGGTSGLAALGSTFLVYERCMGITHQIRRHAEHYGLWEERANFFDTQYVNGRNLATHPIMGLFFNQLHLHSVHHLFVKVPFYRLEEAHRRLSQLYRDAGVNPSWGGYVSTVATEHRRASRAPFVAGRGAES